jgi:hypothetical protein
MRDNLHFTWDYTGRLIAVILRAAKIINGMQKIKSGGSQITLLSSGKLTGFPNDL